MDCSKITKGFVAGQCGELPTGGTGTKVVIFNFADVDKDTSVRDGMEISSIALKSQKKGYIYESLDNSTEGSFTLNKGTYASNYDHQVTLRVFSEDADAREFLAEAKEARIITAIERRDGSYDVYGWKSGLKMNENTSSTRLTDNVAYAPVFASDDDSKEDDMPYICTMTESALLALCQSN